MKEETHLVIIEVLATTVEVITSKYDKRGIENRRQADIISRLDDDVVSLAIDVGLKDTEIVRLEGYNSEAIKKIKEKRGFLECIHDKCVNTGVVDIMDKNAMSNVDELIEAFNNRADEVARLKAELNSVTHWGDDWVLQMEKCFSILDRDFPDGNHLEGLVSAIETEVKDNDKILAMLAKEKAKATKATAEKRKLMELIREEVKGGYTGTIRVLDNYKAWQRAQRKPGK